MEDEDKLRMITTVRELFHGRYTRDEIRRLLGNHAWNQAEAVDFVLSSEPGIVRQLLQDKSEIDIKGIQEDELLKQNALKGHIPSKKRQFACEACDNVWWERVPKRKPVSKCRKCLKKFDAISEDEMYGWAVFNCDCGNTFHGYGQMNVTTSECYKCKQPVFPTTIRPPDGKRKPRSRNRHSCDAPDCSSHQAQFSGHAHEGHFAGRRYQGYEGQTLYRRTDAYVPHSSNFGYSTQQNYSGYQQQDDQRNTANYPSVCVHPVSRKKKVVVPSLPHRSSGSTVDSLLLDDDDNSTLASYEPSLDNIPEESQ